MKAKILYKLFPLMGLIILFSCGGKKQDANVETPAGDTKMETPTGEKDAVKVRTAIAAFRNVEQTASYTANVQAEVINKITPAIPGRIEKIFVEIGDRVQAGQILVQMESSNLQQQRTQLANLQRDYDRYIELQKVGGIAQQQVDQIKTQIDVLKAAIQNIEDNTQLKSPITGIITARNYDNGDVFAQLPILTVQQLNPLKAIIYVSESYFTKVKVGMTVKINLDVYENENFTGKVSLIYPTIDAATHTFGAEVAIHNGNLKVRPGMFGRVTLNLGVKKSIVVPDAAVQKQAGANDKYVFIVKNGVARYSKVELGQRLEDNYEILSGISDGDVVVTAGQSRLIDGTPVEIINN
ncbi:MAG: efflux RND transporter periplasmic adaptor subunit [Dysgonamonadaceae bacterium]|jgi:RND family efflux transporter MFP subunit|nr:efflux RND transporter periplasmic adaptor subunit [Dysgonamonadaceae bacterium]